MGEPGIKRKITSVMMRILRNKYFLHVLVKECVCDDKFLCFH